MDLPADERIELPAANAGGPAARVISAKAEPKRNVLDLHDLGSEAWRGVDAREDVDRLREEWGKSA